VLRRGLEPRRRRVKTGVREPLCIPQRDGANGGIRTPYGLRVGQRPSGRLRRQGGCGTANRTGGFWLMRPASRHCSIPAVRSYRSGGATRNRTEQTDLARISSTPVPAPWCMPRESNPARPRCRRGAYPAGSACVKWSSVPESNRAHPGGNREPCRSANAARWCPAPGSNRNRPAYKAGCSPRALGAWSCRRDSNPRGPPYHGGASPLGHDSAQVEPRAGLEPASPVLRGRCLTSRPSGQMERVTGVEPAGSTLATWRLTPRRHPH
jgi:hypothetical protein